jgi:prophage regulatory protein
MPAQIPNSGATGGIIAGREQLSTSAASPLGSGPIPLDIQALDSILRIKEVLRITGLSRTTLWRLERIRKFPKRRKLGARAIGWLASEIRAWVDSRVTTGESL